MTKQDLWNVIVGIDGEDASIADELNRSFFDEQMEIDLRTRQYRYIYHTEDKFIGNLSSGDFDRLYSFAIDHFVHPEDAEAYRAMIEPDTMLTRLQSAPVPGVLRGDFRLKGTDGSWIWTRHVLVSGPELGLPEGIVHCYVYDTHRQRQRRNGEPPKRIRPVKREEVTGLLDGIDYFRAVQARMDEMTAGWCLIYIKIEHHKLFTDWYGLDSGQYLLTQVAELLQAAADETGGFPGYLGEENFCLTLPYDRAGINALYDDIQKLISEVSAIEGFLPIFGISLIDGSCRDIREYFNHAALTAEEIRDDRHTRIRIYDAELHQKNSREYKLLYAFQRAIERGEISFWLQPQCRMPDQKIVGAESLARWQHPDGMMESPSVFVPILEKYGLVTKLDEYIWDSVCRWLRGWIDRGRTPVPVSVNVSQIDIFSIDVPAAFDALLKKYRLPTRYIKIEITESAYAQNSNVVLDAVTRLRKMGLMVLMDDFGSGYSSLNMLRSLNVDVIKLDAQFLQIQEENQQKGISILESVVNMTRTLSTPIIVEGVETRDQVIFLGDLGCRYMQGYFFYHPMPVAQFETLIADERSIDTRGFIFKANQQLHVREFLDANIYSDAMLNNILGPVAFYCWHGDDVDIIRYNQQFYRLVGIDVDEMEERKNHIQDYLHPSDREVMYSLLRHAEEHRVNGSKGIVRCYRPNGALVWLSLKLYFINEDEQGKKFYASAQDVSEQQFISSDLPGGYYRCMMEENDFEFLYVSRNFLDMTGYDERDITADFENKLINMVHPSDRERLRREVRAVARGETDAFHPYRIRRKRGDYIYVAEQSHITDHYGAPCWQSVVIDVTDVMHTRNQMRVLSDFMSDSILFLRRTPEGLSYEVAIHGLGDALGLNAENFEKALNSGKFCTWIEGHEDIPHQEYTKRFIASIVGSEKALNVVTSDGRRIHLLARADRVSDDSSIDYIVILRCVE